MNSYIDEVYYLKSGSVLLIKLCNSMKDLRYWLIVEPAKRVSITLADLKFSNIAEESYRIWKSLLKDCAITDVSQVPCERIFYLKLNCRSKDRGLVVELLPRGVLCVLDDQSKILLCNEYRDMKDRALRPGLQYRFPPAVNVCSRNLKQIKQVVTRASETVTPILIKEFGLPPEIAETITTQCNLGSKRVMELDEADIACISSSYENLVNGITKNYKPCIIFDSNGIPIGFYPYIPPQFQSLRAEVFQTLNDAINRYFEEDLRLALLSSTSRDVLEAINDIKSSLDKLNHLLSKMRNELNELVVKVNAIENNYYELEQIHLCVMEKLRTSGWDEVKHCGPIINTMPEKGLYQLSLDGGGPVLEFDVRKSFIENYNDLRKKVAGIERSIAKAEEEKKALLEKLESLSKEMEFRKARVQYKLQTTKEWYEAFIWYITSSGFLVIGGKDASQNIKIVRKLLEPNDIVLHADIHGASTVVIKVGNKTIDNKSIEEAAVIAASYSKAWKLKLMSVDVFWVYGSQISLSPPPGQYLPKGSYMVYGTKNYIRNVGLRLAIGVEVTGGRPRIIVGPEEVVDRRAIAYFVVVPGDLDPKTVGEEFVEFLRSSCCTELTIAIDADSVAKRLPGRSNIIKKVVKLV